MKKWFLFSLGWIATALGFLGVFLPLLPTVPFILLAMYCFGKSSPRFQIWLENNRYLGDTVVRIKASLGLTSAEKKRILFFSWLSIGLTIIFVLDSVHARTMLSLILLIETWVILRMKTYNPEAQVVSSSDA
ncbi:YbaN family protein [Vibrio sp. SCSIO 43137]|uniref:YbaN family protein n=1 Tax=Vibrio sp. SCSIO 43137 TaxID=3021011 RepID=UPI002307C7F3|nr:YbaN family protein [Vibrio sp. SCSIO 43137]WCE32454.1 YbaN family protein [Vibrio sp. SCSIO 43137]